MGRFYLRMFFLGLGLTAVWYFITTVWGCQ